MVRPIAMTVCIVCIVSNCGCSTQRDVQDAEAGRFQSRNLIATDREILAGAAEPEDRWWYGR